MNQKHDFESLRRPARKRFYSYIGREMLRRLLQFPLMRGRDFRAYPTDPGPSVRYSRLQDHLFIDSFLCMIFYVYSDCSMSVLEPTGNCIKGVIHRSNHCMQRTRLMFTSQVFACPKKSAPLRMLRLLIQTFGQIDLHNLPRPLIETEGFSMELYERMVHECFPDAYVVENEEVAYTLNYPGKVKSVKKVGRI